MPLAFFCTLFFRHRKKSVSAPWDGQSQSAPESARHSPPGQGVCACGRTKGLSARPLETFGAHPCILVYSESCYSSCTIRPLNKSNQHNQIVTSEGRAKESRGRSQSPLVSPAGAKPLQHNRTVREERTFPSTTKRAKQSPVSPILSCETADYLTSSISREQATKIAAAILVPSASFASALLALCLSK